MIQTILKFIKPISIRYAREAHEIQKPPRI